jgi:hypothetical protein
MARMKPGQSGGGRGGAPRRPPSALPMQVRPLMLGKSMVVMEVASEGICLALGLMVAIGVLTRIEG